MMKPGFLSSVVLTGNETFRTHLNIGDAFWSSVVLTGNETFQVVVRLILSFWSSVVLTGNETDGRFIEAFATEMFYRSNEEERWCIWLTKKK